MPTPLIRIRSATPDDRDAVAALWGAVFGYPEPRNEPGAVFDEKMRIQPDGLLILEEDGALTGTVMVGYDGHRGWIYRLAVDPALRGGGRGRALMQSAEELLHSWGCRKVNLQVKAGNDAVVRFYEELGYRVEPRVSMGLVLGGAENDGGC